MVAPSLHLAWGGVGRHGGVGVWGHASTGDQFYSVLPGAKGI